MLGLSDLQSGYSLHQSGIG